MRSLSALFKRGQRRRRKIPTRALFSLETIAILPPAALARDPVAPRSTATLVASRAQTFLAPLLKTSNAPVLGALSRTLKRALVARLKLAVSHFKPQI